MHYYLKNIKQNLITENVEDDCLPKFDNLKIVNELTIKNKMEIFQKELSYIKNITFIHFIKEAFKIVPKHFWYTMGCSEYGKTPKDELKVGGMILHTKRTFSRAHHTLMDQGYDKNTRNLILTATILHDTFLDPLGLDYNEKEKLYHVYKPRIEFAPISHIIKPHEWNLIMKTIEGHTGEFHYNPNIKTPESSPAFVLYLSDYYANTNKKRVVL